MKYKVEFEKNYPVRATLIGSLRIDNLTDFGEQHGKTSVEFIYVDAENETDALQQALAIATNIFKI